MKITVLGCGALGQLWLSALHKQGHDLQGWLRVPQARCHVHLRDKSDGSLFNASFIANDFDFLATSELLLVTLKAWQVSHTVCRLATQLPPDSPILLLHNGMGTVDASTRLSQPLLRGLTTHAVTREGNMTIHVASGITQIGPGNAKGNGYGYLVDPLHAALPDVVWHDNIQPACWHKLAINCVINPLTALYNCHNGELKAHREEILNICNEVAQVMLCEGCPTSLYSLMDDVEQVIDSTAENISSMLQDVRLQRHTEIDYITGYLLSRAQVHGIPVPVNTRLYEQVKRKENEYECTSPGLPRTWL